MKPKVAFIGTGGTIASVGSGPLDIIDYDMEGGGLHADAILARFPEVQEVAEVVPIRYKTVNSYHLFFQEWKELVTMCERLSQDMPDLAGIVIGHGTGSLEETAYFLNLTLTTRLPVVIVGSQRPLTALSSDAGLNLVNAVRTAACPEARGLGVLVILNDEIQAARDVTKTSTARLQAFQTREFGVLGYADGDRVVFYRKPLRRCAPDAEFDLDRLSELPRVDIQYAYAGSDGTATRALIAAGARGIISAGFAPGFPGPADAEVLRDAITKGTIVMQSTRAGSGRVVCDRQLRDWGFLSADNLSPQKARLLLALSLSVTSDRKEIERIFASY